MLPPDFKVRLPSILMAELHPMEAEHFLAKTPLRLIGQPHMLPDI
jgi:hypothetical protein